MSVIFVFCLTYSSDFISVEKKNKKKTALPRYFSVVFFWCRWFLCIQVILLVLNFLMMATAQVSWKRKAYSILEKLQVVERICKGEMQTKVSREVGIPESTLRGWLKDEEKLREARTVLEDCGQARKRARAAQDQQLETAVFAWFTHARSEGTPLSRPVIQAQALKNAQRTSRGWGKLQGHRWMVTAVQGAACHFPGRHPRWTVFGRWGSGCIIPCKAVRDNCGRMLHRRSDL